MNKDLHSGSSVELETISPKICLNPTLSALTSALKNNAATERYFFFDSNGIFHFKTTDLLRDFSESLASKTHQSYELINGQIIPGESQRTRISSLIDPASEKLVSNQFRELNDLVRGIVSDRLQNAPQGFHLVRLKQFLANQKQVSGNYVDSRGYNISSMADISQLKYSLEGNRRDGVLRLFTATEKIDESNWFEQVKQSILTVVKNACTADDMEFDEEFESRIKSIIDNEAEQKENVFLSLLRFIELQGLSRARLKVTCKIMEVVKQLMVKSIEAKPTADTAEIKRLAVGYIEKALGFYQVFGNAEIWDQQGQIKEYLLDFSAVYKKSTVDLTRQLTYADAFDAMPVWVRAKNELNDVRDETADGLRINREVAYNFRVNGEFIDMDDPQGKKKSAFKARLARIRRDLLLDAESKADPNILDKCAETVVSKSIFQLFFMFLVFTDLPEGHDFISVFERLRDCPVERQRDALDKMLLRLETNEIENKVDYITTAITTILKDKSSEMIEMISKGAVLNQELIIDSEIINLHLFQCGHGENTDQVSIFQKGGDYFSYLRILDASRKSLSQKSQEQREQELMLKKEALSIVTFKCELQIKTLVPVQGADAKPLVEKFTVTRLLGLNALPVALLPTEEPQPGGRTNAYNPVFVATDAMLNQYKVMIHYNNSQFALDKLPKRTPVSNNWLNHEEQLLAQRCSAFTLITYLFLKPCDRLREQSVTEWT